MLGYLNEGLFYATVPTMEASATTPLLISLPSHHPVSLSPGNDDSASSNREEIKDPKRILGLFDGIAIVLGLQIGSGIFASPSLVVQHAGSELAALLIWCIAGGLAWTCAACYIELGTRLPFNGGPQEYLAYCFNDLCGFLASWACIFTVKPCSAAILALVVSDYICDTLRLERGPLDLTRKLVALLAICLVATVNCTGNKLSNIATKSLLACKIFGLGFVIIMGFAALIARSSSLPVAPRELKSLSRPDLSKYTDATLLAMWAYSGWEAVCIYLCRDTHQV
jgi:solute carrier family 7 (L-type amino acid transporter), member 6